MATRIRLKNIDSLYRKAKEREQSGDWEAAEKYYREALAVRQNPGTWGVLGWVLYRKALREGEGNFSEALAAAHEMRALAIDHRSKPLLAIADCLIGRIHHDAGQAELAERFYCESVEARLRPETLVFLGKLMEEAGRGGEAKRYYQQALQVDPGYREARYNLAVWYRAHKVYDEAGRHFRKALESDPEDAGIILQLASTLWHLGKEGIKEAKSLLDRLLRRQPLNLECRLLLAFTYKLLRQSHNAELLFRLTLEQLPPDSRAYWSFAWFLGNDFKEPVEAEILFEKALETSPQTGAAHYHYGQFLLARQQPGRAQELFRKAAALGLEKAKALLHKERRGA